MDEVEVSGLRIGYEREGTGPALVLLHGGFGFDSRSWRRRTQTRTLAAFGVTTCGRGRPQILWTARSCVERGCRQPERMSCQSAKAFVENRKSVHGML